MPSGSQCGMVVSSARAISVAIVKSTTRRTPLSALDVGRDLWRFLRQYQYLFELSEIRGRPDIDIEKEPRTLLRDARDLPHQQAARKDPVHSRGDHGVARLHVLG